VEKLLDEPRVVTEDLGGSPLARLAIENRAPVEWYLRRPRNPNEWRERARRVHAEVAPGWLERLGPALEQHSAAAKRLARVVTGQGVLVTTGQQPGLFGGPIFTTAKALSALALADALEVATGIPTAPVFWAATDDADFAEAASTVVIIDGAAQELRIPRDPRADGSPLFRIPLPIVDALLARLEEASGSTADATPLALVRRSYRGGQTIGSAYVQLLAELLGPLGITIVDAGHDAVRAAGQDVLRKALTHALDVERAIAVRDDELRRAGFAPQVESVPGRSLVFDLRLGKQRVPVDRAAATARDAAAEQLSPNVLLRPVLERALLPTVAYVAGPSELAYFAQAGAVAHALSLAAPLAVPRWSLTIVEPHVQRTVNEFGLALADLAALPSIEARFARQIVPQSVSAELLALRGAIDERLAELRGEVETARGVPLSSEAIEGARRALQFRVDRLERRVIAAAKHTDKARRRQLAAAAASLFPLSKRQERTANLIPFLARYGSRLLESMCRGARAHADRLVSDQPSA
jgi:bacillithiol biosynthesis cysteine-adding enzyme BshC